MRIFIAINTDDHSIQGVYTEDQFENSYKNYTDSNWNHQYWLKDITVEEWDIDTQVSWYVSPETVEKFYS